MKMNNSKANFIFPS